MWQWCGHTYRICWRTVGFSFRPQPRANCILKLLISLQDDCVELNLSWTTNDLFWSCVDLNEITHILSLHVYPQAICTLIQKHTYSSTCSIKSEVLQRQGKERQSLWNSLTDKQRLREEQSLLLPQNWKHDFSRDTVKTFFMLLSYHKILFFFFFLIN